MVTKTTRIKQLQDILNNAVAELKTEQGEPPQDHKPDMATCGDCGLTWDDSLSSSMTPVPAGRCPFEYFHTEATELKHLLEKL